MGFSPFFIRLIMNNLAATKCSILVNGKPCGFFSLGCGDKQGGLLSPILFILASEGFGRGLNAHVLSSFIRGFEESRMSTPSHLGFADDLLIFLSYSVRNLQRFMDFLNLYQKASGQQVNLNKIQVVVSSGLSGVRVATLLGMRLTDLPIKYLGVPLHCGIFRASHCQLLLADVDNKLNSWSNKLLSAAGRLTLIRSVLTSIPLHLLAVSRLPNSVITDI